MAIFAITFRIKQEGNHQHRWETVVEAIEAIAQEYTWEETTSFYLIKSGGPSKTVRDRILSQSAFDAKRDKLLVINLTEKGHAPAGAIECPTILSGLLSER